MSKTIVFEIGCRGCDGLVKIAKTSYVCNKRMHLDDTPVIPFKDGQKTRDWYICKGKYYTKSR